MPTIINKKGSTAVVKSTVTETITLASLALTGETISSVNVTGIWWSGTISISRGGGKLVDLSGSGQWPLGYYDISLNENNTSDIAITITGAGTVVLELSKQSSFVSQYNGG